MAPLPPESTARFYLDYDDGVNQHTLVARLGAAANLADAMSFVHGFLQELEPVLSTLTIVGARFSSDNSNVTNPVTWNGLPDYGTGVMATANAPRELRFIGRSTDGRRVSVSVYGYNGATPDQYRVDGAAVAPIAAAIDVLDSAKGDDVFLTISTLPPVWKTYASFNFNSYWERQARP